MDNHHDSSPERANGDEPILIFAVLFIVDHEVVLVTLRVQVPPFAFSTYAVTAHCRDQLFQLARTRFPQVAAVRDALVRVISAHLSP